MNFKFRVGQKVKFKSADELTKITNYEDWSSDLKLLAGKIVEIYGIFLSELYEIKFKDQVYGGALFKGCYFEDLEALVEV